MISKKVTIKNPTGLHLRPAGLFCKMALEYESKITFHYRDTEGNAKSVLSVLALSPEIRLRSCVREKMKRRHLKRW